MKRRSKVFAIILTVAMVLSMTFTAFAAAGQTQGKGAGTAVEQSASKNNAKSLNKGGSRTDDRAMLTGLKISDISMKNIFTGFSPDTMEYTVNVQDDIYGVKITPTAPESVFLA